MKKNYVQRQIGKNKKKKPSEKILWKNKTSKKKCFQNETTPWEKYNPFEFFFQKKKNLLQKKKTFQKINFEKENKPKTNPLENFLRKKTP